MQCPIFDIPHLGENTLRGYGSFTFSQEGMVFPTFHFFSMRCSATSCMYIVNTETIISFKAGQSERYDNEYKALEGLVQSVIDYAKQVIRGPEDFAKLVQINEGPGNQLFWNQYHKMRLLFPNAPNRIEDLINPIKSNLLKLNPHLSFVDFSYQTINED